MTNRISTTTSINKTKVILIQGASGSGKSTITSLLLSLLSYLDINAVSLSTDNYYLSTDSSVTSNGKYDFDNPAAIDWDAVKKTFIDYGNNSEIIKKRNYSFETEAVSYTEEVNSKPSVILFEGIFSFNIFSDQIFDVNNFNCFELASKHSDEKMFISNDVDFNAYFDVTRIYLDVDREIIERSRISRYLNNKSRKSKPQYKGLTDDQALASIKENLEKYVFPSSEKWVSLGKKGADFIIKKGSFSDELIKVICNLITHLKLKPNVDSKCISNHLEESLLKIK
ncbi:UCKA [Hepatospora eriocheir]|uniref:UCKA n=1 Tax=Hepatospora eriocheir TaxID=1081669 RepID=A0A1X0Q8J7_9MICR|nr:UCKA [Hepatospora eriocheir]